MQGMFRFSFKVILIVLVGAGLWWFLVTTDFQLAQTDPNHTHSLDELASRTGSAPLSILKNTQTGLYPSERTIFYDTLTGTQTWRVSHDAGNDAHDYYDVPAWNLDGSLFKYDRDVGVASKTWIFAADSSWGKPLDNDSGAFTNNQWSWTNKNLIYYLRSGQVYKIDHTTGIKTLLNNIAVNTGIPSGNFRIEPPHPQDDRLLFDTRSSGRFFVLNPDGSGLFEIPTDGRWAVSDGAHRTRWTKSPEHEVFIGQNNYRTSTGAIVAQKVQYIVNYQTGALTEANPNSVSERGGHPDTTADGAFITGSYEELVNGDIWLIDKFGNESSTRIIFSPKTGHHSGNSWDGRWHVADNEAKSTAITLRGLTTSSSISLNSFDGRSQNVLAYHYSSYGAEENTHPAPVTSPDGTKAMYQSDMLRKGVANGASTGNADVWVSVIRRPFEPRAVVATPANNSISLSWQRPLHAGNEIYWNPGNLAREIKGYYVLRSDVSGGPFTQIHDSLVTTTNYTDTSITPGRNYFYVVQAVEHSAVASLFSSEVSASSTSSVWNGSVRHFYEIEGGILTPPMVPQMDWQKTSGGWFVGTFAQVPDNKYPLEPYPAKVTLTVTAPKTATYYLWVRATGFGASGSFDARVDGGTAVSTTTSGNSTWEWKKITTPFSLTTGTHQLELLTSTPNLGFDTVAVTDESLFVPTGMGNKDTIAPTRPTQVTFTQIDITTNKLTWARNNERDFDHYNVYVGRDTSYPLGNPRLLLSPTDSAVIDWGIPTGIKTVYKITAVDRFGNESIPAVYDPDNPQPDPTPSPSPSSTPLSGILLNLNLAFEGVVSQRSEDQLLNLKIQPVTGAALIRNGVVIRSSAIGTYSTVDPVSLTPLTPGSIDLIVYGPRHLSKKFSQINLTNGLNTVDLTQAPLKTGDAIDDDVINIYDYNELVGSFGCQKNPPLTPIGKNCATFAADLDFSGKIDIYDYNFIVGNFNLRGEGN